MTAEHTREPWTLDDTVITKNTRIIASVRDLAIDAQLPTDRANARRIVACVNACEGIDTLMLETVILRGPLNRHNELRQQCDELAEALRPIAAAYPNDPGTSDLDNEQPVGITLGDVRRVWRALQGDAMNTKAELKELRQAEQDRRQHARRRAVAHYSDQARIAELELQRNKLLDAFLETVMHVGGIEPQRRAFITAVCKVVDGDK